MWVLWITWYVTRFTLWIIYAKSIFWDIYSYILFMRFLLCSLYVWNMVLDITYCMRLQVWVKHILRYYSVYEIPTVYFTRICMERTHGQYLLYETPSVVDAYFEIHILFMRFLFCILYVWNILMDYIYCMRLQVWLMHILRYISCLWDSCCVLYVWNVLTDCNYCVRLKSMSFMYRVYLKIH